MEASHCRLCAAIKPSEKLINLQSDITRRSDILKKLSRLNANNPSLFEGDCLPNTVCLICADSLEKAYEFVLNIGHAQKTLSAIYIAINDLPKEETVSEINDNVVGTPFLPNSTDMFEEPEIYKEELVESSDFEYEAPLLPNSLDTIESAEIFEETVSISNDNNEAQPSRNIPITVEEPKALSDNSNDNNKGKRPNNLITETVEVFEEAILESSDNDNNVLRSNKGMTVEDAIMTMEEVSESSDDDDEPQLPNNPETVQDAEIIGETSDSDDDYDAPLLLKYNSISLDVEVTRDTGSECSHNENEAPQNNLVPKESVNTTGKKPKKAVKKIFSESEDLVTWKDFKWACAQCEHEFPSVKELISHSMLLHDCCNAFKCTDCKTKVLMLDKFLLHVKRHRNHLRQSCYICYTRFFSSHEVYMHKYAHSSLENVCAGCNSDFPSSEDKAQHVKSYFKTLYGKPSTVTDLSDNLDCPLCNKSFRSKCSLNGHLLNHVQSEPKERVHICHKCGKGYFRKVVLASHINYCQEEARMFQCDMCEAAFKTLPRLKNHKKLHSDIKPYSCKECGRTFRLKTQLNKHGIIHTDSLPFPCPHCSKAFRFRANLKTHLNQHTGAQPYSCNDCDRRFTDWANCNKHMKRIHGTSLSKKKSNFSKNLSTPALGSQP